MDTPLLTNKKPPPDWVRFYKGRRIFVTGHTGFKGSWLCEWLLSMGARVTGFSLEPNADPSMCDQIGLASRLDHRSGDVRDSEKLTAALNDARPDVVFHLAAQPLVRRSYTDPEATHEVNFLGTVRLLEALRRLDYPCAAVVVTSDKCYENTGVRRGYRENDRLGGHDPYSSSKACAELAVASYRRSFFSANGKKAHPVRVASARAGNVIGGGDWSADRIIPDCIRNLIANRPIPVRNRHAIRPWQHVLEPLRGYLLLAARMHPETQASIAGHHPDLDTFNFGPNPGSERTVQALVDEVLRCWPGQWQDFTPDFAPHEAAVLTLNIEKAARLLDWRPRWTFRESVQQTVAWYRAAMEMKSDDLARFTRDQIDAYMRDVTARQPSGARRSAKPRKSRQIRQARPQLVP